MIWLPSGAKDVFGDPRYSLNCPARHVTGLWCRLREKMLKQVARKMLELKTYWPMGEAIIMGAMTAAIMTPILWVQRERLLSNHAKLLLDMRHHVDDSLLFAREIIADHGQQLREEQQQLGELSKKIDKYAKDRN